MGFNGYLAFLEHNLIAFSCHSEVMKTEEVSHQT